MRRPLRFPGFLLVAAWLLLGAGARGGCLVPHLRAGSPAGGDQTGAERVKRPVSVRILPRHQTVSAEPVGDVIVRYADGTDDAWTLRGNCTLPRVGEDGIVGWVTCELAADGRSLELYRDQPVGSRLTLCRRGRVIAILPAAKPFIEEWGFAADHHHVVVKSRASHGVASIELFGLRNGPAEATVPASETPLPPWARPYGEE